MKLSTLLAATVSAANIDRRVDIDVKTGEVTEYRSESGMFYFSLLLLHQGPFKYWTFSILNYLNTEPFQY